MSVNNRIGEKLNQQNSNLRQQLKRNLMRSKLITQKTSTTLTKIYQPSNISTPPNLLNPYQQTETPDQHTKHSKKQPTLSKIQQLWLMYIFILVSLIYRYYKLLNDIYWYGQIDSTMVYPLNWTHRGHPYSKCMCHFMIKIRVHCFCNKGSNPTSGCRDFIITRSTMDMISQS